jgi:hypothetical protein
MSARVFRRAAGLFQIKSQISFEAVEKAFSKAKAPANAAAFAGAF